MDIRTPDFPCPECLATGRVNGSGNNPQPYDMVCNVCDGRCDLTAEEMLAHCMSELRVARKAMAMSRVNPYYLAKFRSAAKHWLHWAKQARAKRLEQQHAGAAHIGRGFDNAA